MNIYYVYEYLREDGTPYYIGKGKGNRAFDADHCVKVPPRNRIRFVAENIPELEALRMEKELILLHGRKDLGTGILRNLTTGGDGPTPGPVTRARLSEAATNRVVSDDTRAKLSAAKKGKKPNNYGKKCNYPSNRKWDRSGDKHPLFGMTHSPEAKQAIGEASRERMLNKPIVTCPHCNKQGKEGMAMRRWHFDNCRHAAFS